MKKLGVLSLVLIMLMGMIPTTVSATEVSTFEQEFAQYLTEVSDNRGFEVTKDNVSEALATFDTSFDDIQSVSELDEILGEVILSDLSNLSSLYEEYGMDEEALRQLLTDNGESLEDYIYLMDLKFSVYFYKELGQSEPYPDFNADLLQYLSDISMIRGFEITTSDIEATLTKYYATLEDFNTVEALSEFFGEVIKADLSNLTALEEKYELDQTAILEILETNNDNIDNYIFLEDLEFTLLTFGGEVAELDPEAEKLLSLLMEQLTFSEEEMQRIEAYFTPLEEYFSSEDTLNKLMALAERMNGFENVMITDELTEVQITELESIYQEFLSVLKLKITFTLSKDGVKTPLTFRELLQIKDFENADFIIELYGSDMQFLADFVLTDELLDSIKDLMVDTVETIEDNTNSATGNDIQTVKGAKLPKTASNYLPKTLAGILLIVIGIVMLRKTRNARIETNKNQINELIDEK